MDSDPKTCPQLQICDISDVPKDDKEHISQPKGYFLTKIFHPNVGQQGEICVNTLKKDWKPDLGIKVFFNCSVSYTDKYRAIGVAERLVGTL